MGIFSDTEIGITADLYKFNLLDQQRCFTSADSDVVYDGLQYNHTTIRRGAVVNAFSAARTQLTIDAGMEDAFDFLANDLPNANLRLTFYRYNLSTAQAQLIFVGDMDTYTISERRVSVTFRSDGCRLDQLVPRVRLQPLCNHALYGTYCGISKNVHVVSARVIYAVGDQIQIENKNANQLGKKLCDYLPEHYTFGVMRYNTYYRVISGCYEGWAPDEDTTRLCIMMENFPPDLLKAGDIVFLYPGCKRDRVTCLDRFDNTDNFLGFPFIPNSTKDGTPVPIAYGTVRLDVLPIWLGVGSVGAPPEYIIYFWGVLCYGPVTLRKMYCPIKPYPAQYYDLTDPVEAADCLDGMSEGGPTDDGYFNVPGHTADEYGPIRNIAHVWSYDRVSAMKVMQPQGSPTSFPDISVEVLRDLAESPVTPYWITGDYTGVSPAAAIYDLITNNLYGVGIGADQVDLASFNTVSVYCQTKSYSLNAVYSEESSARKIIDSICDTYGFTLALSSTGKLTLIALNSTDALTPVRTIYEADINSANVTRGSWDTTFNRIVGKIREWWFGSLHTYSGGYMQKIYERQITVNDQASQMLTGRVLSKEVDLTGFGITHVTEVNEPAFSRLYEILKDHSIPRMTGTIKILPKHDDLLAGQSIRLVLDNYGIDATFQIVQRDIPDNDMDYITLEIRQLSNALYNEDYQTAGDDSLRSGGEVDPPP